MRVPAVWLHRPGHRAAVRAGLPAAGRRRAAWQLVCAAGAARRTGRAPAAGPLRRLPLAPGRGGGAGPAPGAAAGNPGGRLLTVGDWLAHWLVCRTATAPSTVRGYGAHVRLYLAPYLGQVLLAELSAGQVQAMFTAITRQHQELGSPVTAATLNRIRATLRAALNAAIRRGLITGNPASRAELPRARRPRAVVWTPYRAGHWKRTGDGARSRCGPPRRPRSSSTPSSITGCMPPTT